jgi:hypothetical protein
MKPLVPITKYLNRHQGFSDSDLLPNRTRFDPLALGGRY